MRRSSDLNLKSSNDDASPAPSNSETNASATLMSDFSSSMNMDLSSYPESKLESSAREKRTSSKSASKDKESEKKKKIVSSIPKSSASQPSKRAAPITQSLKAEKISSPPSPLAVPPPKPITPVAAAPVVMSRSSIAPSAKPTAAPSLSMAASLPAAPPPPPAYAPLSPGAPVHAALPPPPGAAVPPPLGVVPPHSPKPLLPQSVPSASYSAQVLEEITECNLDPSADQSNYLAFNLNIGSEVSTIDTVEKKIEEIEKYQKEEEVEEEEEGDDDKEGGYGYGYGYGEGGYGYGEIEERAEVVSVKIMNRMEAEEQEITQVSKKSKKDKKAKVKEDYESKYGAAENEDGSYGPYSKVESDEYGDDVLAYLQNDNANIYSYAASDFAVDHNQEDSSSTSESLSEQSFIRNLPFPSPLPLHFLSLLPLLYSFLFSFLPLFSCPLLAYLSFCLLL